MAGRRSLVVVTALLVVLAGCSGLGPGVSDPGSAETTTTTDTGLDTDAEPIYEPPLNTTDVAVEHVVELRRAGSFAYESTVTIVEANRSANVQIGREAAVEMESGAMLVTRNDSGVGSRDTYHTGDGTRYSRTVKDASSVSFNVSDSKIDTSRYAINGVPRFLDMFSLSYDGLTTLDGQEVYRYSATSPDQVESLRGMGGSEESVESIGAYLYVTESGLITQLGYSVAFDTGDGLHNIKAVTKYTDVGDVTVSQPDWVEDAEAAERGELNVTRTLTNETADAQLTLTANRALFDSIQLIAGPGPLYDGNNTYEEAAASSAVTAVIPPTATNASVTLGYDESAVPEGGESDLAVYRYVIEDGAWEVVDASQDTNTDEFTIDISESETLVVMHEPTWDEFDSGHT